MNQQNHQNCRNGQYRRPRPHFSDEKAEIRPTVDRRQLLSGAAMLLGLAMLLILGLTPRDAQAPDIQPDTAQVRADTSGTLNADCQVIQHLTFVRCGHQLTRRQTLPAELAGKGRDEVTAAYDAWQISSIAPAEVVMERRLELHCPEHVVLMPDEGGMLCIFRNRYGDALALEKELNMPIGELPDAVQSEVRPGKGFDTQEALEQWLESVES